MTANVPGATRLVYIVMDGDPCSSGSYRLHDAVTGAHIDTVEAMQLTVEIGAYTCAILRHIGGLAERVEIVPAPTPKEQLPDHTRAVVFSVERDRDPVMHATLLGVSALAFDVRNGKLVHHRADSTTISKKIDDHALTHGVMKPEEILHIEAEGMAATIAKHLMNQLLYQHPRVDAMPADKVHLAGGTTVPRLTSANIAQQLINNPPAGWSVQPGVQYSPKPTRMVADAIDAVRKKQVCDECGGTGWYQGFSSRQPCSKGCKP